MLLQVKEIEGNASATDVQKADRIIEEELHKHRWGKGF